LKGKVNFVGVASMETGDPKPMIARNGIDAWPLARDVGGSQASGLHDALAGSKGLPVTAFYDANGKLLNVQKTGLVGIDLAMSLEDLYGVKVTL
jgi:hypothetical protein